MAIAQAFLESKEFPYKFTELGATTIIQDALGNSGVPQIMYMDNVLPLTKGYTSVSFTPKLPAIAGLTQEILDCLQITATNGSIAYIAVTSTALYVYDASIGSWQSLLTFPASPLPVSLANVKGRYYLFVPSLYLLLTYNFGLGTYTTADVQGIDLAEISGIADSGDRLIIYSYNKIYWSSVFDALDFIPSLATGAGSSDILAIRTLITCVVSLGQDFIIYTVKNAVSAKATGDFNYPYIFTEIVGSAGAASLEHVAYNSNAKTHVVWTPSGFQEVNTSQAQYIFSDLSDGIARAIQPSYQAGYPTLVNHSELEVLVRFASNRWLCISTKALGAQYYSHCYVLDTLTGRWGKLSVRHNALLEYWPAINAPTFTYSQIPTRVPTYGDFSDSYKKTFGVNLPILPAKSGDNFAIATPLGSVFTIAPSETAGYRGGYTGVVAEPPKIVFGKFKYSPSTGARLEEVRVGNLNSGSIAAFGHNYSGGIHSRFTDFTVLTNQIGTYKCRFISDSISLEVSGIFTITQLELDLFDAGALNMPLNNTELQYRIVVVDTAQVFTDLAAVVDVPIPVNRSSVPQSS